MAQRFYFRFVLNPLKQRIHPPNKISKKHIRSRHINTNCHEILLTIVELFVCYNHLLTDSFAIYISSLPMTVCVSGRSFELKTKGLNLLGPGKRGGGVFTTQPCGHAGRPSKIWGTPPPPPPRLTPHWRQTSSLRAEVEIGSFRWQGYVS